jgi:parvulin-like peptidyl-prolyl isomerase
MTRLIVNGEAIDPERIRQETAAIAKLLAEQLPHEDPIAQRMRAREWADENLIEEALKRQAESAGLRPPDNIPLPGRSEVMAFYREKKNAFFAPELVNAAHIVCNIDEQHDEAAARATIERAQAELANGRSFAEVADELSNCPGRGGDLGFFPRGQMVESFDAVVFSLSVGQVSEIFRTEFGFHIAKLIAKKPEGIQPFDQVRGNIEQHLLAEKRQAVLHQFVDELRAKADIRREK